MERKWLLMPQDQLVEAVLNLKDSSIGNGPNCAFTRAEWDEFLAQRQAALAGAEVASKVNQINRWLKRRRW